MPLVGGGAGFFAMVSSGLGRMTQENKTKVILEALRHTELHLEDLQGNAASSEQRAFQFAATCILLATLIGAFASTVSFKLALIVSSSGLVVAAFWAFWSVLPRRFHIRGHRWEDWKGHVDDNDEFIDVIVSQAEENDARIKENFQKLEDSAFHFRISLWIAFLAVAVFVLGQLLPVSHYGGISDVKP